MERLAGTAKNVRHTVQVRSEGRRTDHLALFEIDGRRLCFRGLAAVSIEEGDDLVVVWEPGEKGIHTVVAYRNRTLDVRDHDLHPQGCTGCGCTTVLLLLALVFSLAVTVAEDDWISAAFLLVLLLVFVVLYWAARRADAQTAERRARAERLLDA